LRSLRFIRSNSVVDFIIFIINVDKIIVSVLKCVIQRTIPLTLMLEENINIIIAAEIIEALELETNIG
jgi:hypothetical protein